MGYAGGTKENPTYRDLGDHTETIQIDFDPDRITYAALLDIFLEEHDACGKSASRQYMSAIFHHDDGQRRLAEEKLSAHGKARGRKVATASLPFQRFYLAEDYHQKYALRQVKPLAKELLAIYAELRSFVDSTAAARLNGYVAGHGESDAIRRNIPLLGLTPAGQALLETLTGR